MSLSATCSIYWYGTFITLGLTVASWLSIIIVHWAIKAWRYIDDYKGDKYAHPAVLWMIRYFISLENKQDFESWLYKYRNGHSEKQTSAFADTFANMIVRIIFCFIWPISLLVILIGCSIDGLRYLRRRQKAARIKRQDAELKKKGCVKLEDVIAEDSPAVPAAAK